MKAEKCKSSSRGTNNIIASVSEWKSISNALMEVFGSGSHIIMRQIGVGIGREYAKYIKHQAEEKGVILRFKEVLFLFSKLFAEKGWGNMIIKDMNEIKLTGTIEISSKPYEISDLKYLIHGILTGFMEAFLGRRIFIKEISQNQKTLKIQFKACSFHEGGDSLY